MTAPPDPVADAGRTAVLIGIEQLCDEFEAAWRAGGRPPIEDFLGRGPPGLRGELLEKLLEVELGMRNLAGENVDLQAYRGRFPQEAAQVEAVYRRMAPCRRLGDYELLEQLGHGGMGEVYRARQVHLNQIVALKLLPEQSLKDSQAIARFRREMLSIGALDHPNIVRAYNAGEAEGRHFLVMEYVEGINLQRLVERQHRPLTTGAACEAIRQAALGLQHAHERGLIHRDIKPANLILNRAGAVKILDFGLARFDVSDLTQQLSQQGLALGTVDYMSPEQAENSSTVDGRADIYSLGCTLFFLLTGRAPYADKMYDTLRKRLMAHAVAPIPALLEACPDCPEDLDDILGHTMAKDPDDRTDSLEELADTLALFAEPPELVACAVQALATGSAGQGLSTGTSSQGDAVTPRAGSRRHSKSRSRRRPWYRRFLPVAASVVGLLLLGAVVGWRLFPRPTQPGPELPAATAVATAPLATEVALLPGLNGQWWFDEMPWYLPFVRQAVAETLAAAPDAGALVGGNPAGYLDPNTVAVQRWLEPVVAQATARLSDRERQLLRELRALANSPLEDSKLPQRLEASLQQFLQGYEDREWSAADLHAQALLQHKLAALRSDRSRARAAKQLYEAALNRYAQTDAAPRLHLLCHADFALLCARVLGDYRAAQKLFERALPTDGKPLLFAAETRVAYGAEAANAGEYRDDLFLAAKKLLDGGGVSKHSHPLGAHVCERLAWSLMDQWKVEEASKQFGEATSIRGANKRAENPFATIYLFHNRHGTAVALRYRGNAESARRVFKTLVGDPLASGGNGTRGEIEAAVTDAKAQSDRPGQQRYLRDLLVRWANSMERWADCELYGGAASGAPVNLARACALYDKARKLNENLDQGTWVVMTCKLCLVLALHGKTAEAREVFERLRASPQDILGPDRERAELIRQVAEAVLKLKAASPPSDAGQKALRAFLDQFNLNPTYSDKGGRRETLEFRLFCAELLLSSELEAGQAEAAQRDRKYLDPLLANFHGRADMRRFLRPYYDLALRACDHRDLVQMAQYLIEARAVEPQETLRSATLLLFHFAGRDNFAIFLPRDGRAGKSFPLTLTRAQIKEAASRGQRLRLDAELVTLVQGEVQAGRPLDVFWSDAMCWADEDEGLADSDWPFGDQLDLAALRKTP